jgi:hypothetical protein
MNKSQLIWGIILLLLAAALAVANLTLSADSLMFTVGDQNMPWVPVIALAVIGVVLLVSATRGPAEKDGESPEEKEPEHFTDPEKVKQNKRLENIGWGLFLVMLGCNMLVPDDVIPGGAWTIGIGLIMLGLNVARYSYGIRMSGFTTFLGILAIISGSAQLLGVDALQGATFFIILGAYLILKPWFEKRQLFGKVEES